MPTVTVRKQTNDMFGNNCEPCNDLNFVNNEGLNNVVAGNMFRIDTRPSRLLYNEQLPEGFRTKRITVKNMRTLVETIFDESNIGGNPAGGIAGATLGGSGEFGGGAFGGIYDDLEVTVDFGAGPHASYNVSGSVVDGMGASGVGGSVNFEPQSEEDDGSYLQGEKLTVYATPDEGYEIENLSVNGNDLGPVYNATIDNVNEPITVECKFCSVEDTKNILRIKGGNTAGIEGEVFYDREMIWNVEKKELRIGINPNEPTPFNLCYLLNGGGSSGAGSINPVLPTTQNCLASWYDNYGNYIKNAGAGAFVTDGLFVKRPMRVGDGEYILKTYADTFTQSYGGIINLNVDKSVLPPYYCNYSSHPRLGFVANIIENVKRSEFGGGLLIYGTCATSGACPSGTLIGNVLDKSRVSLAIRPRDTDEIIEALYILQDGIVRCDKGIFGSIDSTDTYNINGVPHEHDARYLRLLGGVMQGDIDAGGNKITGLSSPTLGSDAVTLDYISGFASGVLWQAPVLSIAAAPVLVNGRYLVAPIPLAETEFEEHANDIATYDGTWSFESPADGWATLNETDTISYVYNGSTWVKMSSAVIHTALQGLNIDDHLQYVHLSNDRTITANHTFEHIGIPFTVGSGSDGLVENLNANYLDGAVKGDFALAGHGHDWAMLSGFQVINPIDGQILTYDSSIPGFKNADNIAVFTINSSHVFADTAERIAYFAIHGDELEESMFISVGTGFQQYIGSSWVDKTAIIRGPAGTDGHDGIDGAKGDTGEVGPEGPQGVEGPQGEVGNPGTSINMRGTVANTDALLLITGQSLNDGYYCEADGDCYIWDGEDTWVNVGPVVGPRGIQGERGPQGIQGMAGPRGLAGAQGIQGPYGPIGPRGPAGVGGESWQLPVEDIVSEPPENYEYNDRFIVSHTPIVASDFEGHADQIVTWMETDQWFFDTDILVGTVVYNLTDSKYYKYNGSTWEDWVGTLIPEDSGLEWISATTSGALVENTGYITNAGTRIVRLLPATCAVGKIFRIAGVGSGGWRIGQNEGQKIIYSDKTTYVGATGFLQSGHYRDCVELLCIVANTEFQVISSIGTLELNMEV